MTTTTADEASDDTRDGSISGAEIRLAKVTKKYAGQKVPAVDGLSLVVPAGEIVMFVGPSGCGKTTSLKMINRLIEPTSGSIHIADTDVREQSADELRRNIGYVIQGGSLFPHMTVARNIGIVPKMLGWEQRKIAERVDELLDLVGLDADRYRNRYPRELSGGQQQRVGVARGLAADPPVILMDEPFGAVDPITRQRLQDELLSIQRELGKTIVCVTHDIDEAIKLGDRILILREGAQVAQYDTPEAILATPADDFVADFVGAGSSLKQLSLTRVSSLELGTVTTAKVGEPTGAVLDRARRNGDASVVVLDEHERPVAWPWLRQVKGEQVHESADEPSTIDWQATLNDALDTMLTSGHGAAIVTGMRDQFLGVIGFEEVTSHMKVQQETLAEADDDDVLAESDPEHDHQAAPPDEQAAAPDEDG